ncbi:hypothetical protein FKP32DRAFT_1587300 [Trametes sanguinea]|nr:hypothetical protein FKP32DRAFT_1587300 [Trametes sanguinea]
MDRYAGDDSVSLNIHRANFFEKQSKTQATKIIDLEAKVAYLEAQVEHLQGRLESRSGKEKETYEPSRDDVPTRLKRPASPEPPLFENRLPSSNDGMQFNPKKRARMAFNEPGTSTSFAAEGSTRVSGVEGRSRANNGGQTLPQGIEARMAALPWFRVPHLPQHLQDMIIKRTVLNKLPLSISAQRRFCRSNDGRNCIFLDAIHAPYFPSQYGAPGLLFSASSEPQWRMGLQSVFAASTEENKGSAELTRYMYVGEYQLRYTRTLSEDEYRSLPVQTRDNLITPIVSGSQGFEELKARLVPDKHRAQQPHSKGSGKLPSGTARNAVHQAYERGEARIHVWIMECTGFDQAFLERIYETIRDRASGKGAGQAE